MVRLDGLNRRPQYHLQEGRHFDRIGCGLDIAFVQCGLHQQLRRTLPRIALLKSFGKRKDERAGFALPTVARRTLLAGAGQTPVERYEAPKDRSRSLTL